MDRSTIAERVKIVRDYHEKALSIVGMRVLYDEVMADLSAL